MNMTEHPHNELLQRYLNGEMTPGEEKEFLLHASDDPSLADALKAQQEVNALIADEKAACSADLLQIRRHLEQRLSGSEGVPSIPSSPAGSTYSRLTAILITIGLMMGAGGTALLFTPPSTVTHRPEPAVRTNEAALRHHTSISPEERADSIPTHPQDVHGVAPAPTPSSQGVQERVDRSSGGATLSETPSGSRTPSDISGTTKKPSSTDMRQPPDPSPEDIPAGADVRVLHPKGISD